MKKSSEFRASGFKSLEGKWGMAILAALIASALGAITYPTFSVTFNFDLSSDSGATVTPGSSLDPELIPLVVILFSMIFLVALAFGIALALVGSIVATGYGKFNLDINDGNAISLGTLFKYFPDWKRIVVANLLVALRVILGLMLFIIPGIIASYNYVALPYILAEDPSLSAREAVEKSKEMMHGNRWRFFCLQFSFIGWSLLSIITCGIVGIWVTPYMQATAADFYREISGTRPTIEGEDISDFFEAPIS